MLADVLCFLGGLAAFGLIAASVALAGEALMGLDVGLGLLFAAVILVYGLVALVRPEKF